MRRRLRMGLVGGGRGAFIGVVHRMAAELDGLVELAAGALSGDPERAVASGRDWGLPDERTYRSYEEMLHKERGRPEGKRIDLVAIATPNHLHHPVARAALEHGFAVVCDKPLAVSLDEARDLARLVEKTGLLFAVTYNYSGYPMVKEARERIRAGELGRLRKVLVEYPQGWLATPLETTGQKQASWRTDPARAGASCCVGDIGTHAAHLAEYVTGLAIEELCAELATFVPGRRLDDDAAMLLRLTGGVRGVLVASQIAVGEENGLRLRVYGEKAGLEWAQQEPSTLWLKRLDGPTLVLRAGTNHGYLSETARRHARLPAGHPEGYLEAFANIYRNVALALLARRAGEEPDPALDFPGVRDGVRGMAFIEAAVESARRGGAWTKLAAD